MDLIKAIENKLVQVSKQLPPLPDNVRQWLAEYAWLFAMIGAILGGFLSLFLLTGVLLVKAVTDTGSIYLRDAPQVHHALFFAWIALAMLIVYLLLLAKAVTPLKKRSKAGWNLLFYGNLLFIAYDIFNWLQFTQGGLVSLVRNLIGSAIGLYFLFQVREKFTGRSPSSTTK